MNVNALSYVKIFVIELLGVKMIMVASFHYYSSYQMFLRNGFQNGIEIRFDWIIFGFLRRKMHFSGRLGLKFVKSRLCFRQILPYRVFFVFLQRTLM